VKKSKDDEVTNYLKLNLINSLQQFL